MIDSSCAVCCGIITSEPWVAPRIGPSHFQSQFLLDQGRFPVRPVLQSTITPPLHYCHYVVHVMPLFLAGFLRLMDV